MAVCNINFPETDVVSVRYTYRTSKYTNGVEFDEFDHEAANSIAKAGKDYFYKLPEKLVGKVRVGQAVVVHCVNGYQVAEISQVNTYVPETLNRELDMVVDVVDMDGYKEEIEKRKQREALKRKLLSEKKRLESMVTFEMIAEKYPEFKQLLDQFKEIGGSFD